MNYIEPTLKNALECLKKLEEDKKPIWGSMNAIGMIEHLSESMLLSQGKLDNVALKIPEDKIPKAKQFLFSEKPMPRNFKAPFGTSDSKNKHAKISDALLEFENTWRSFELYFSENPESVNLHPTFGWLNHKEWLQLHNKHLTHHFQQFGLIAL